MDSRPGGSYSRMVALLMPDGQLYAQTYDAQRVGRQVAIGRYQAGKAYTVEITTSETGATLYFYAKGAPRDTGVVYRSEQVLGWDSLSTVFYTYQDAAGPATALVDNVEERSAAVTSRRYDCAGRLEQETDAQGVVTRYVYDALGRMTDKIRADGRTEQSTTHYVHDATGGVADPVDGAGRHGL